MQSLILLVIVATALSTSSAFSQSQSLCESVEKIARGIMTKRQNGESMSAIMRTADSVESEVLQNLSRSMIIDAYETPRFHTKEYKNNVIGDFADKYYLACVKGMI